ncbi:MAG: hypothetical protein R3F61_00800 [Myxococcota bacterium]
MSRVLLVLVVSSACRPPCAEAPTYIDESGVPGLTDAVAGVVEQFVGWTGQVCLAEVSVTENAPPGSDLWWGDDGWKATFAPDTVSPDQIRHRLCQALWYGERPQLLAPGMFPDESAFTAACQLGPTSRGFVEQDAVCGLPPLTPIESFLEDEVFLEHAVPEARDLSVTREEPVFIGVSEGYPIGRAVTQDEQIRLVRSTSSIWAPDTRVWLEVRSWEGVERLPDLPLGSDLILSSLAADADRIVLMSHRVPGFAGDYDLLVVDRSTGAVSERAIDADLWTLGLGVGGAALVGDALVRHTHEYAETGSLIRLALDGSVTTLELPRPERDGRVATPTALWPDPTDPESLIVAFDHRSVLIDFDVVYVTIYDWGIARVHLPSEQWETLARANPWDRAPTVRPFGVMASGDIAVFAGDSTGTLVGTLDGRTSEWAMSPDHCVSQGPAPHFALRDHWVEDGSANAWEPPIDVWWSRWSLE